MAITLKISNIGKAKVRLGGLSLFFKIVNKHVKYETKVRLPKHILAFATIVRNAYFEVCAL